MERGVAISTPVQNGKNIDLDKSSKGECLDTTLVSGCSCGLPNIFSHTKQVKQEIDL